MTDADLGAALPRALGTTDLHHTFPALAAPYRGKVRDVYRLSGGTGDEARLLIVTTDRISAFDHVFDEAIPYKGQVLNRLAAHNFERIADVAPHHLLGVPHGAVALTRACTPVPVEFVVRGHLAGHALRQYEGGARMLCGVRLPDGLRPYQALPTPVLTPATKAAEGHDEDTTLADVVARGILSQADADVLHDLALALFRRGQQLARSRGLVLLDTKFEFGRDADGQWRVIDEVLTPDSSRYVHADGFGEAVERGQTPQHLSKEFMREWLLALGYSGDGPAPALPSELRVAVARRYLDLYETLTGAAFVPDDRHIGDAITV